MMFDAVATFASHAEGIAFEQITFPSNHPSVTKIEASSINCGDVTFRVFLTGLCDSDDARAIATHTANRAADKLSFYLGKPVTDPHLVEDASTEEEVDASGRKVFHAKIGHTLQFTTKADSVKVMGGDGLSQMEAAMSQVDPPGESNYVLFRTALSARDSASKFLALYQILALIVGDRKKGIDNYIIDRGRKSGLAVPVGKIKRPDTGEYVEETHYTRLRNEYMHARKGVSLATTRAEMESNLDDLITLTRMAIRQR